MNEKLRGGLRKFGRALKLLIFGFFLVVVAATGAGLIWLQKQPLGEYKKTFLTKSQEALGAQSTSAEVFKWSFKVKDLSLGVVIENFRAVDFKNFSELKIRRLRLATQPLKILFGKFPADLEILGPELLVKAPVASATPRPSDPARPPEVLADEISLAHFPAWLRFLRVTYRLEEGSIEQKLSQGSSVARLENLDVRGLFSGFPGSFDGKLKAQFNVDRAEDNLVIQGPVSVDWDGFFQSDATRVIGFKVEDFNVDFDKLLVSAPYGVEKSAHESLRLSLPLQVILKKDLGLANAKLLAARLHYDKLQVELSGEFNDAQNYNLRWVLNPSSLDNFHAPFAVFRKAKLKGLLETNGHFLSTPADGLTGNWKFSLNNFSLNPAELDEYFEKDSSGKLIASVVSEGTLKRGRFSSPRTEVQLRATDAGLVFKGEKINKPRGDEFEVLIKGKIADDTATIDSLIAKIHTLQLRSTLRIEKFSEFLAGQESPVQVGLQSNRVDLSKWRSYLRGLEKAPPLEGFFEFAGSAEGRIQNDQEFARQLSWRIDRASLSNFRSAFGDNSLWSLDSINPGLKVAGPFALNFIFQGRGVGSRVDRATLLSRIDLTQTSILYNDFFRKPENTPLVVEMNGEQTRNQLQIKRGQFRFHTLNLNFGGTLVQGNRRSFIEIAMDRPVQLSDWREFFIGSAQSPVDGRLSWSGRIGFPQVGDAEENFDWQQLTVEGKLQASDLRGRLTEMRSALTNGQATMVFQPQGVLIPQVKLAFGKTLLNFSGEIAALNPRSRRPMTLHQLLVQKAWDLNAQLHLNEFAPEDFASSKRLGQEGGGGASSAGATQATFGETLRSWFDKGFPKSSRMRLAATIQKGKFADIQFANLQMRALWDNHLFKMQPFSMEAVGGKIAGTLNFDVSPYYSRKDQPELTSSLKVQKINLKSLLRATKPEMEKTLGGLLTGELTLASHGWEPEDLVQKSRGRVSGQIDQGEFETLMVLQSQIEGLISNSAARDYLLKEARQEKCLQKNFVAQIDSEIKNGGLEIGQADLKFAAGSQITFKGRLDKNVNVDLLGDFQAGRECLGGDVQKCLAGPDGRALIPFKIQGPAAQAKANIPLADLTKKIVTCATAKTVNQAKAVAEKHIETGKSKLEDMAREKLKKIFK